MELRISTWNCFGMGQGLGALTHLRAPYGKRLTHADVVSTCCTTDVLCVQELLSRQAQEFFDAIGGSRFIARFRDDNRPRLRDGSVRGTGLGVSARAPLNRTVLRNFSGARLGWDRFARKGALYVEVALDEKRSIDVVTAHLQAGYDAAAARVRASQLAELRRFIDEVGSPERPFVVCGDFNIDGLARSRGLPEYRTLVDALDGFVDLGADDDLPTFHPDPKGNRLAHAFDRRGGEQRIDYIFMRPSSDHAFATCTSVTRFFDRPLGGAPESDRGGWASDHYGLNATLTFDHDR